MFIKQKIIQEYYAGIDIHNLFYSNAIFFIRNIKLQNYTFIWEKKKSKANVLRIFM